jgi:prepilin-type N-terminal cleavage/methylation domain-containing protein
MNKTMAKHGFTLIELIVVTAMIAVIGLATVGIVRNSYNDWKLDSSRSALLQDGQAAVDQMVRILRQVKGFDAVSASTDQAGYVTFISVNDTTEKFSLNTATDELEYTEINDPNPDDVSTLIGAATSLSFTSYDIDGNVLADPVQTREIQSVSVNITLTDPEDSSINLTFTSRVFSSADFMNDIIINEFMYNPAAGGNDAAGEWVELINIGDSAIDVSGWTINIDSLTAHPQYGNGSTTIPAGGYAVIIPETTLLFTELATGGDFESKNNFDNNWTTNNWSRTKWNPHTGSYKGESTVSGAASLYTDISVPSGVSSCLFNFWEMTTASVAQTQITATIRNYSDTVLATGYTGQMNSSWTSHTMDLTAFAGQDIRIHFSTNKSVSGDALLLDDISVAYSDVDSNAIILSTGDNQIGTGLGDNSDTVEITNGSRTVESVSYDDSWGGDGDGTTLARIDPLGSSDDQANWTSGPVDGTPGSVN